MHFAAKSGQAKMVERVIRQGLPIDSRTLPEGETPLMLAAEQNLESCKLLLTAGADPLAKSIRGKNAIHYAAEADKEEIIRLLLNFPRSIRTLSQVNEKAQNEEYSKELLMIAARKSLGACRALLEAGANPDSTKLVTDLLPCATSNEEVRHFFTIYRQLNQFKKNERLLICNYVHEPW